MADREKVVKGLYDLRRYLEDKEWSDNRVDRRTAKVYWQTVTDAITMLKDQETLLKKSYELLADMGLDFFCEDLICNDGWCDDHCTTNGTTTECVERWLRKQISEGR